VNRVVLIEAGSLIEAGGSDTQRITPVRSHKNRNMSKQYDTSVVSHNETDILLRAWFGRPAIYLIGLRVSAAIDCCRTLLKNVVTVSFCSKCLMVQDVFTTSATTVCPIDAS